MFGRNWRDAEMWRLHRVVTAMRGVVIPGRSLISMNACVICYCALTVADRFMLSEGSTYTV